MRVRRSLITVFGLLGALTLSGCVVFLTAPTASQNGVIGSVRVTVRVCASNSSGSPPPGS